RRERQFQRIDLPANIERPISELRQVIRGYDDNALAFTKCAAAEPIVRQIVDPVELCIPIEDLSAQQQLHNEVGSLIVVQPTSTVETCERYASQNSQNRLPSCRILGAPRSSSRTRDETTCRGLSPKSRAASAWARSVPSEMRATRVH